MRLDTNRMRADAEAELRAAQGIYDAAKVAHERKIATIEAIEQLARNGQESQEQSQELVTAQSATARESAPFRRYLWAGVRPAIRRIMREHPNGATLRDIAEAVGRMYPGRSVTLRQISRGLYSMHRSDELRIIREQTGSVPALYALPDQSSA